MADRFYYPDGWREYCRISKISGTLQDSAWKEFALRYRAARSFHSVFFTKQGNNISLGYSAGVQLLLAYSAFELACKASGMEPNEKAVFLFAVDISEALRRVRRLYLHYSRSFDLLRVKEVFGETYIKADEFVKGSQDNIQPICAIVTNLVACGQWLPSGRKNFSMADIDAMEKMSISLLWSCEELLFDQIRSMV